MQRTFVAIAFALALTSALAAYTPSNYVKAPQTVIPDTETNFTNKTGPLILASVTVGDVYIVSQNLTLNTANLSASNWAIWMKKLDGKALTVGANSSYTIVAPYSISYYNNYAYAFVTENDTGIPQLNVYQQPLTGGAALPRFAVSTNTNATFPPATAPFNPTFEYMPINIGKVVYVFYVVAQGKVNVTSFTVGGSRGSLEFTLTTAYTNGLQGVWGEALGTSQVLVSWFEGTTLKDSVVPVTKGSPTVNAVGGYTTNHTCTLYATDKKWYGELCFTINADTTSASPSSNITYWVRTNTTNIVSFATYPTNTSALGGAFPYGPYVALIIVDNVATANSKTYNYELWNLDTLVTVAAPEAAGKANRTKFLTIDTASTVTPFRVQSGGLYTLLYNNKNVTDPASALTSIQVGLLLGGSYLTSVLGFLLTIVAGLLLF